MAELKLKFDASLEYQNDAITSIVDLFRGLPLADSTFTLASASSAQLHFSELGISNPVPDEEALQALILANLHAVQQRNNIPVNPTLEGMNFSVEMETGTGKTYVYLRTLFELHKVYGFTKFVIVTPSIAIREGVLASISLLSDHFRSLYDNVPFAASVYDSKYLGRVRQFATSNTIQLLVMNIQAFQKDVADDDSSGTSKTNVINRPQDRMSGRRPIEFVQATRPVVVLDEPQSMESDAATAAIDRLRPMCTLRYSATHKRPYNRTYRLGPVEAYDLNLVKRIEVASVVAEDNPNAASIKFNAVDVAKSRAQVTINHGTGRSFKPKKVWVKAGEDLAVLSGGRQEYASGWIVSDISFRSGAEAIEFANGSEVTPDEAASSFDDDVRRAQVVETVRQHLDKERTLTSLGVKVLSLFFIDKVANYRATDADGNPILGQIGQWFESAYNDLAAKPRYASLKLPPVSRVHAGYFSVDSKKQPKDTRGDSAADVDAYDLIMRDKERLLSAEEPLRFIFSHSALREGWDNPNVFQICTLNVTRSPDRKRQEIGRGLRLPVNQEGERVFDPLVNHLTVVANESYDRFARELQSEYEEDTGQKFGVVPDHAFAKLVPPARPSEDPKPIGQEASAQLWSHLQAAGYLAASGNVLAKFDPSSEGFVLGVPESFEVIRAEITDTISRFVFTNRILNARRRQAVRFRKQVMLDPDFKELWDRVSKRTRYRVSLCSDELVEAAASAIANAERIYAPMVRVQVVELEHREAGISADRYVDQRTYSTSGPVFLPDILADLQNETGLTRATLVKVLQRSGRLRDFIVNPQTFTVLVTSAVNAAVREQMVKGITYEPVANLRWEMHRLVPSVGEEIERYASRLYRIQHAAKTVSDYVDIDSEVERRFARGLDDNQNVRFFMKLPTWFTVDTPIGTYNPDWALIFEDSERVYLVRETKSSLDPSRRRSEENVKIECAGRHFAAIDVDYAVVTSVGGMIDGLSVEA